MSGSKYTRRRVLAVAGAGLFGITWFAGSRRRNYVASIRHTKGEADDSPFDPAILNTVVDFVAAYFGISVSSVDRAELLRRLTVSTTADSNWRVDYRQLADIADDLAQQHRQKSFSAANEAARYEILAEMLPQEQNRRNRRLRVFLALVGEELIKMQRSTIPHLARLYRTSGVPWRRRGYTSWPGVGGETFAYANKPAMTGC